MYSSASPTSTSGARARRYSARTWAMCAYVTLSRPGASWTSPRNSRMLPARSSAPGPPRTRSTAHAQMARNEHGPFLFWVMILTGRPWKSMSLSAHSSFITSRSSLGAVDGARDDDGAGGGSGASSWEGSTTAAADMTGAVKGRATRPHAAFSFSPHHAAHAHSMPALRTRLLQNSLGVDSWRPSGLVEPAIKGRDYAADGA
jgi:hypothetical protein